ncbi:hypothetical protein SAY86_007737 [Trapa natans]|uniref:Uncharacterized protein n=1 Tax=Trapa natans TaxID=22666 RepID=A0AAN7R2F9_TRANT|nr:hypothetical protein SAY86_007737 [Trapa natans]
MSKAFFLVVLLGLAVAAAEPPHYFRHRPEHEHMPPSEAPGPARWPFYPGHKRPHDHKHGHGHGPFAHPPSTAEAPHHHGHHFHVGAFPPMMGLGGHGPQGRTMPPAHAPHIREHLAPAY